MKMLSDAYEYLYKLAHFWFGNVGAAAFVWATIFAVGFVVVISVHSTFEFIFNRYKNSWAAPIFRFSSWMKEDVGKGPGTQRRWSFVLKVALGIYWLLMGSMYIYEAIH